MFLPGISWISGNKSNKSLLSFEHFNKFRTKHVVVSVEIDYFLVIYSISYLSEWALCRKYLKVKRNIATFN